MPALYYICKRKPAMNEKLLQYLWNFKIFTNFEFKDINGHAIEVLDFGRWNFDSGPDFLFGKIRTQGITTAGHIELHVKSSDWIFHRHSGNPEFDNLIAHVVYTHDAEIPEFTDRGIPTIVLENHISPQHIARYTELLTERSFIACEMQFNQSLLPFGFHESNVLRKLDSKAVQTEELLAISLNDYEAVLFQLLAYAFGLKVNAPIFQQLAASLPFAVINKIRQNQLQLEALFYGICGWLHNPTDDQMKLWKREFDFLKAKYNLPEVSVHPKFSRLRPPAFPTIRLSQLANLYHIHQNLFSKLMTASTAEDLRNIFRPVQASEYWNTHFNMGKVSSVCIAKKLTEEMIHLVLINAVLPLRYLYFKNTKEDAADEILRFYEHIPAEKNKILNQFTEIGAHVASALESQSLLYHYSQKCLPKRCLQCDIGVKIMRM